MIASQATGNNAAVTVGGMQGPPDLNAFEPPIGATVLRSIDLLVVGTETFAAKCVDGLASDRACIAELVDRSPMPVTALAPRIGYDDAARIARHAHPEGQTLRAAGPALGCSTATSSTGWCGRRRCWGDPPRNPGGLPIAPRPINRKGDKMGVMTVGAMIGGAIDSMSGDDSAADGALIGGITAGVLKLVLPIAVTYAVGWAALKGLEQLRGALVQAEQA